MTTNNKYEIGQAVSVNDSSYMQDAQGIILDTTSSITIEGEEEPMYTIEFEDFGTQFFFGTELVNAEGRSTQGASDYDLY
jgi:hypothetical protein